MTKSVCDETLLGAKELWAEFKAHDILYMKHMSTQMEPEKSSEKFVCILASDDEFRLILTFDNRIN